MASRSSSSNKTTVLTEQLAIFTCQTQQEWAFRSLKSMITTAPVLYDLKEESTIQCDASEKTALLQKGQPVVFISRSLTSVEQNYAQREKESLFIVSACKNFNQYIHGWELTYVHTDHRPVVPNFSKPIYNASKRLKRMFLRLQKYNLSDLYFPGKEMYIAGMFSLAYVYTWGALNK